VTPTVVRWLVSLALTAAAGSAAAAVIFHSPSSPEPPASVLGGQLVKPDHANAAPFVVSGDVTDLAPGVTRPLQLRLTNPNDDGIAVQTLQVTVADSPTGCSGGSLQVGPFAGPLFVPGGGEARVSLPVTMATSAGTACQGATFPLTYGGSAEKA
jgi:hypothetical protein